MQVGRVWLEKTWGKFLFTLSGFSYFTGKVKVPRFIILFRVSIGINYGGKKFA